MADVQKEKGYTAIANEIMDALVRAGLQASELCVVLFILRKTYGWNKKSDQISLTQFCEALPYSKQTIVTALKRLQLVKLIRLVQSGNSKVSANEYAFNKDFETWQLVRLTRLVKSSIPTSQVQHDQLVKPALHTKDRDTKTRDKRQTPPPSAEALQLSQLLLDCILVNNDQYRHDQKTAPRWAVDIDKLIRIDGFTYQQVEFVIKFCQNHDFWHKNILSGEKLRKQFDRLVTEAKSKYRHNGDNVVYS